MRTRHTFALLLAAALSPAAFASCGVAFCAVNSNWTSESALTESGTVFDLRYEHIYQARPRSGSSTVAVGQIPRHHDEVRTINDNMVATFSKLWSSGWGVTLSAPLTSRDHLHVHNHRGAQLSEQWRYTELGDARVVGRYQMPVGSDFSRPAILGFTLGVKLPTGRTTIANNAGSVAERSLQPGTGTTDGIIGAYYHQKLPKLDANWFTQVQYQRALSNHEGFRPGAQLGVDVGLRKALAGPLAGLLQLNYVARLRDKGTNAEPNDSGGRAVYLSPGLAYAVSESVQVYGFWQQPVYQYVNGVQLTAAHGLVMGLTGRF